MPEVGEPERDTLDPLGQVIDGLGWALLRWSITCRVGAARWRSWSDDLGELVESVREA